MGTFSFKPMGNDHALNIEDDFLDYVFGTKNYDRNDNDKVRTKLLGLSVKKVDRFINEHNIDPYCHYVIPYTFNEYQAFEISVQMRDKLQSLLRSSLDTYFGKPVSKDHYDGLLCKKHYSNDLYYFHYCIELYLRYFDEIFDKKVSLNEAEDINIQREQEKNKIKYQEQQNEKVMMVCPHCGKEFEADEETSCKLCGKEIDQKYFDFDMVKEMLIGNYHCAINLFPDEDSFLKWAELPLKKTGTNQYTVNGLTYKYDDNGMIIDVSYDFEGDNDQYFLQSLLNGDSLYESGLLSGHDYDIYKIMFDKIKNIKGDNVIYRIKNRGIEYYAMYDGTFNSPFFDSHINVIQVDELPERVSKEDIIKALKKRYE